MMTIEYHPNPEQFLGTGTVFIAWDRSERWDLAGGELDGSMYLGYWDSLPDTAPAALEEMPRTESIDAAVEWGRKRTSRVLIRPESDPDVYYWAGIGEPHGVDADLPLLVL